MIKSNIFRQQQEEQAAPSEEKAPVNGIKNNLFRQQMEGREVTPKPESIAKSSARTLAQAPLGLAKRFTWPADLLALFGQGEALSGIEELDEHRIDELKQKFPQAPWENFKGLDKEKLMESLQAASSLFPTQANLERGIESLTGLPLEPKNALQKTVRLGSTAAGFRPGDIGAKATAGVAAPVLKKGLEVAGVPEAVAEPLSLLGAQVTPQPMFSKVAKPSGLTARQFEKTGKPTKISPARHEKITEAVEGDFKKISDQLLSENKTYSAIKEDPLFKEKVGGLFEKVENLAEKVEGNISPEIIRSNLRTKARERLGTGITPNEYEKAYAKEMKALLKDLPREPISAPNGVKQFRKNNKSLGQYFEPGKSSAFNQAKKDALLDYNRSIEGAFEETYPDTEFDKLFKFTNKRWQEISDVENAEKFMNEVFDGKINYGKAKQLFNRDKEHVARPFKRLLGEEGFKDFQQLTEDLLSSEKAYSMLKKAGAEGNKDLLELGAEYIIHPKIAATHGSYKLAKRLYQSALDKPQIAVKWKSALDALKKGKYSEAEEGFKALDVQAKQLNHSSK